MGKRPLQNRKQIRLRGWDYRNAGAYFVTICTHQRVCSFGQVENGRMCLSDWGQVVVKMWRAIPDHFKNVALDKFICMPNHVHVIIWILVNDPVIGVGQRHAFDLPRWDVLPETGVKSGSLGAIVGSFKSAVTREINDMRPHNYPPIWQPRFHDRIIRNERELNAIRQYIENNPQNWQQDHEWNEGLDDLLNQKSDG